jgi:hypothetical protein
MVVFCVVIAVGLVALGLGLWRVNAVQNDRRAEQACASILQVRDAALGLTKPASDVGVTDPNTLERIRQANVQRAKVSAQLRRDLSC